MTTFHDGPAKGQCLMLRSSPPHLRVTCDRKTGKWDALDQPEDTPRPTEEVFNYRLVKHDGMAFVCARGGRGGPCQIAQYALDEPDKPVNPTLV